MRGIRANKAALAQRALLHATLIVGAAVFGFPFLWMIGTSFKTTREMASGTTTLLPGAPPTPVSSPWIDESEFAPVDVPDGVEDAEWEVALPRIEALAEPLIRAHLEQSDVPEFVNREVAESETMQGVVQRVAARIADAARASGADSIVAEADRLLTPAGIAQAFDAAYRRLELGQVRARDERYRYYALDEQQVWRISSLTASSATRATDAGLVTEVHRLGTAPIVAEYRLAPAAGEELSELSALFVGWRGDRSWAAVEIQLDFNGARYHTEYPISLFERSWIETEVRLPARDAAAGGAVASMGRALPLVPMALSLADRLDKSEVVVRLIVRPVSPAGAWWEKLTRNYHEAFREVPVARYLATSFAVALLFIVCSLFSCSIVAYSFARLRWPGRDAMFLLLLATMMLPPQVTMIPTFLIFKEAGLYNSLEPLWLIAAVGTPFFIFLLRQYFKTIPADLEEAARIDGCNALGIYWHVMLPLVRPALAAVGIFAFLASWNDFLRPLVYLSDERLFPLSLGLFKLSIASGENVTLMMAAAFTMTLPIVVVFFFAQRYFIEGVTLTGTKG